MYQSIYDNFRHTFQVYYITLKISSFSNNSFCIGHGIDEIILGHDKFNVIINNNLLAYHVSLLAIR